jgi:hypothetical protein
MSVFVCVSSGVKLVPFVLTNAAKARGQGHLGLRLLLP